MNFILSPPSSLIMRRDDSKCNQSVTAVIPSQLKSDTNIFHRVVIICAFAQLSPGSHPAFPLPISIPSAHRCHLVCASEAKSLITCFHRPTHPGDDQTLFTLPAWLALRIPFAHVLVPFPEEVPSTVDAVRLTSNWLGIHFQSVGHSDLPSRF